MREISLTTRQNPFHLNQFGGALSGPIVNDRTFFFVDYGGMREQWAEASTSAPAPSTAKIIVPGA